MRVQSVRRLGLVGLSLSVGAGKRSFIESPPQPHFLAVEIEWWIVINTADDAVFVKYMVQAGIQADCGKNGILAFRETIARVRWTRLRTWGLQKSLPCTVYFTPDPFFWYLRRRTDRSLLVTSDPLSPDYRLLTLLEIMARLSPLLFPTQHPLMPAIRWFPGSSSDRKWVKPNRATNNHCDGLPQQLTVGRHGKLESVGKVLGLRMHSVPYSGLVGFRAPAAGKLLPTLDGCMVLFSGIIPELGKELCDDDGDDMTMKEEDDDDEKEKKKRWR
ncbi:uncharacterized protein BO96DRAFT_388013 [Aspergillus niger CBS 101883]|uniref:Uncharacterized protein n=2 Tax=Aspergillus niger TaxID=5061 RepID=A5AAK1_ASPNC|nr:uncharacterized protein BO96DRAFT_388013 [Aspergillus niger CBS 101883]XP_059605255.1 hypothetical protein An04g01490 [Aspergillus niger]PYH59721.1 hypothetical protein BO96DRAFT_388013 [Aspergillus niger CBS 101883]CAK47911.1 hypothetical protein An04g01490 [Aspergillus niger]